MMSNTILPSENEAWGFRGTINRAGYRTDRAWDVASTMIAAKTGAPPAGVRDFLDSRHGRHFADSVIARLQHGLAS
jgi:hypothetical protein